MVNGFPPRSTSSATVCPGLVLAIRRAMPLTLSAGSPSNVSNKSPQFDVCLGRRRSGIDSTDRRDSACLATELGAGGVVQPKRLKTNADIRFGQVAKLVDFRHDSFDCRNGDTEDAVVWAGDCHGGDVAVCVDDRGTFKRGVETDIQLESLVNFPAAREFHAGPASCTVPPDGGRAAQGAANNRDRFADTQ